MIVIHKRPEYIKFLNNFIYKKDGLIHSKFYTNRCGEFKVVEKTSLRSNDRRILYKIIFENTNTIKYVSKKKILSGEIKDQMYPTICNVGYLGNNYNIIKENDPILCKILYYRWKNLIERIYDPNNVLYKNYGALGVTISNEWLNFSNFYNDIINHPDFNREKIIFNNYELDKDIKQQNLPNSMKVYSKNTISIVPHSINMKYIDIDASSEKQSKYFIIIDKNNNEYLEKNIIKFAKKVNAKKQNIVRLLNKNLINNTAKGYRYRYPTKEEIELIKKGFLSVGDKINK